MQTFELESASIVRVKYHLLKLRQQASSGDRLQKMLNFHLSIQNIFGELAVCSNYRKSKLKRFKHSRLFTRSDC